MHRQNAEFASLSHQNNAMHQAPAGRMLSLPLFDDSTNGRGRSRLVNDSTAASADTTDFLDSLTSRTPISRDSMLAKQRRDSLSNDSTARLKYFHHQRKDVPYVKFRPKKDSRFFAKTPSSLATRSVEIDSTGKFVVITEKVAGFEPRVLLRMPIEEFIRLRIEAKNRDMWEELAYKYELQNKNKDIEKLISDITNIDIPLPSAGFLSIFGPPKINLKIAGAVDIHGAWRNEKTEGVTTSQYGNSRSEPDFKQQVQINVNGMIGDKLKISADWNTERTFEYENQLKLVYTGYEDEIVQSVEAGNVSLQTSSLVGGSEALFGVKAQFQLGPLKLTTLASQKKGEIKEVSISGGSTTSEFTKHAYEYSPNHYFIDEIYADTSEGYNWFYKYYGLSTPDINQALNVKQIEVWKTITGQINEGQERRAIAWIDLPEYNKATGNYDRIRRDSLPIAGEKEIGRFIKLNAGTDYELHPETGFITFKTSIQQNDAIAVAYILEGPSSEPEDDRYFGELLDNSKDSLLVLKLIKPQNLQPSYKKAWKLQLKNIYPTGGRGVSEEGFEAQIVYSQPGQEAQSEILFNNQNVSLLNAFGLDIYSSNNASGKDGKFDFFQNKTIITETGEIIFPRLEPFGRSLPASLKGSDAASDSLRFNAIYDTTQNAARNMTAKDRFLIKGKYSASSSSTFNLGFTGVVENSVKVRLGGNELQEGVDYVIDYNIGQVTIRNPAALVPGADLKISYEQNDLFQLASKTLMGLRGELNLSKKTRLGFSALNLNQETLSDKVRIGEEPLNNSIYGVDLATSVDLPFITQGLNNLISTKEMSSLAMKGEFAYINPDPNTKKSTVASDKGESIAYIDDFEGTKRTIPVGISYTSWRDLSVPDSMKYIGHQSRKQQMTYKAKSFWFNNPARDVLVNDIWPKKDFKKGDEQVTVLDYVFDPTKRGTYNYSQAFAPSVNNWGGMMKLLSSTANNLIDENIEFIEFWMKIVEAPDGATIKLDMGKINEDVIPDGKLNSEDKNNNGLVDDGEDIGMDGLTDIDERANYGQDRNDPSGDNYNYFQGGADFTTINGQEGNAKSIDAGRIPDTEDLNNNLTLDQTNSYFRYEIPLDTNSVTNPIVTGAGNNGWHQYRIPIKDFVKKVGDPSFSIIEFMRLWVNNYSSPIHLRFAEFNLVGNQWEKVIKQDTILALSVVNIEENPYYASPKGVQREKDRSNPDDEVERNEQSLSLIINGLEDGQERQAVKYLRNMDLFNYSTMKLFMHGDKPGPGSLTTSNLADSAEIASEVYFRFGSDSLNYYEYSMPLRYEEGVAGPGWTEMEIPFAKLTALKQVRDSSKIFSSSVDGRPGHYYRLRGRPALTNIAYFLIGVKNPKEAGHTEALSGQVWVNELRVIGADDSKGWAYSSSATLKIADVLSVNFNMSQQNPFFHKISDRFGSRLDTKNWGLNMDVDILKLLPFNMPGSNLKLNYSRNEAVSKPLYQPGTDIKVAEAAEQMKKRLIEKDSLSEQEAQRRADKFISDTYTLSVQNTYTLSGIKLRIPTKYWLINDTFNGLTYTFTYTHSRSRNPATEVQTNWSWNAGVNYSLSFDQENYFYPAKIPVFGTLLQLLTDYRNVKVYYTPQSLNWNISATRNASYSLQRVTNARPSIAAGFRTTRNAGFTWKITEGGFLNLTTSYNMDIQSSLDGLLKRYDATMKQDIIRSEKDIWDDILSGKYFGRDFDYSQSFELRTAPKLPSIWNIGRYFTVNAGYRASYKWSNNFTQEELGRSAGFSNGITTGMTLKLKSLMAPLFKEEAQQKSSVKFTTPQSNRGRDRRDNNTNNTADSNNNGEPQGKIASGDSTAAKKDSMQVKSGPSKLTVALSFVKSTLKYFLFDYETININYTQDNTVTKSGLYGKGSGIYNFWGVFQEDVNGPSRAFMLGLSHDVGRRAPNGNLTDNFSHRNGITLRTSRPLWEGATIDINWKVNWSLNKSTPMSTDSLGHITFRTASMTGNIERSFVSFPPVFFLSMLKSGIKNVHELYDPDKGNINDAFLEGFETLPIFGKMPFLKEFARYIPRPNWSISWDGLEKYSTFKSWAKRVSLTHAYSATYTEGWKLDTYGKQIVQGQKVQYGFQPLMGMNVTFNQLWGGDFSGSAKYSTKTAYDLNNSNPDKITETFSREIGISASFSKRGFEVPIFGISFKNDVEFTVSYTSSKNSSIIFNMKEFTETGIPQEGTIRSTLEPRVKFQMSSKLTLSLYYKYSSVKPEGAAKISPTTTNEAGLDVRIQIQ